MEKTPNSMRKHIGIFGRTNAGKSSLFNAILGQNTAIVSSVSGTTTDPIAKPMELIGYGAVTLVDTAGFGDLSELGAERLKKTEDILNRCDLAILAEDITDNSSVKIDFGDIPYIKVYTKCDMLDESELLLKKEQEPDCVYIESYDNAETSVLHKKITEKLLAQERDDQTFIGSFVNRGDTVVLVIPIDSAAPKGRLILPQVQILRDCLDNNITAICVTPELLSKTLTDDPRVDLVITDSQIFGQIAEIVPENIALTSFSMILANKSGKIRQLIEGAKAIKGLKDNDNILMLEACTHTTSHEDIGRVKIPNLLQKVTGKKLNFTYLSGYDIFENFSDFSLIIHCGGCMMNKRAMINRFNRFEAENIPVTNYGVVLAYLNGILDRASKLFMK